MGVPGGWGGQQQAIWMVMVALRDVPWVGMCLGTGGDSFVVWAVSERRAALLALRFSTGALDVRGGRDAPVRWLALSYVRWRCRGPTRLSVGPCLRYYSWLPLTAGVVGLP